MKPFTVIAVALFAVFCSGAIAAERVVPFSQGVFEEAQSQGLPILVDVWASWCPTCARQEDVLNEIFELGAHADMVVFRVDYDEQRDTVRAFQAPRQSTLIVFRGQEETGRAVAITSRNDIEALLQTAYDR